MKDKLLFGTIGLLVGIVVMQWTATGNASYVTLATSGIVGVLSDGTGAVAVVDQDGHAWRCAGLPLDCWTNADAEYQLPLPVPISTAKFIGHMWLVTIENHIWVFDREENTWKDCGPWPGSPVPADQSTWGRIKAKLSGKDQ